MLIVHIYLFLGILNIPNKMRYICQGILHSANWKIATHNVKKIEKLTKTTDACNESNLELLLGGFIPPMEW